MIKHKEERVKIQIVPRRWKTRERLWNSPQKRRAERSCRQSELDKDCQIMQGLERSSSFHPSLLPPFLSSSLSYLPFCISFLHLFFLSFFLSAVPSYFLPVTLSFFPPSFFPSYCPPFLPVVIFLPIVLFFLLPSFLPFSHPFFLPSYSLLFPLSFPSIPLSSLSSLPPSFFPVLCLPSFLLSCLPSFCPSYHPLLLSSLFSSLSSLISFLPVVFSFFPPSFFLSDRPLSSLFLLPCLSSSPPFYHPLFLLPSYRPLFLPSLLLSFQSSYLSSSLPSFSVFLHIIISFFLSNHPVVPPFLPSFILSSLSSVCLSVWCDSDLRGVTLWTHDRNEHSVCDTWCSLDFPLRLTVNHFPFQEYNHIH